MHTPPEQPDWIVELQAEFAAALPGRMAQLEELVGRVRANPEDQAMPVEVLRFLHKVEGSAESYGFRRLGQLAHAWQERLRSEGAPEMLSATWLDDVEALLTEMQNATRLGPS